MMLRPTRLIRGGFRFTCNIKRSSQRVIATGVVSASDKQGGGEQQRGG